MAGRPLKRMDGKCNRCGQHDALTGQSWCSRCFRDYQKSKQDTVLDQAEGRGFSRGVSAMVKTLADEFDRFPGVKVTMDEAADMIRRAPRPVRADSQSSQRFSAELDRTDPKTRMVS